MLLWLFLHTSQASSVTFRPFSKQFPDNSSSFPENFPLNSRSFSRRFPGHFPDHFPSIFHDSLVPFQCYFDPFFTWHFSRFFRDIPPISRLFSWQFPAHFPFIFLTISRPFSHACPVPFHYYFVSVLINHLSGFFCGVPFIPGSFSRQFAPPFPFISPTISCSFPHHFPDNLPLIFLIIYRLQPDKVATEGYAIRYKPNLLQPKRLPREVTT